MHQRSPVADNDQNIAARRRKGTVMQRSNRRERSRELYVR